MAPVCVQQPCAKQKGSPAFNLAACLPALSHFSAPQLSRRANTVLFANTATAPDRNYPGESERACKASAVFITDPFRRSFIHQESSTLLSTRNDVTTTTEAQCGRQRKAKHTTTKQVSYPGVKGRNGSALLQSHGHARNRNVQATGWPWSLPPLEQPARHTLDCDADHLH